MLLQEIAADPNETVAELRVLAKTFPNTWRKMVAHLVNKPHKLKYGGFDLYDETGYGPAIDGLTHAFNEEVRSGKMQVEVSFDLMGKTVSDLLPIKDTNLVAVFYEPEGDRVMLGYDAWVDEEDFSRVFDRHFEERTGEVFDDDNDQHLDIYEASRRDFNKMGMVGLLISCSYDGMKPMFDVENEAPKGFFKGIEPFTTNMDLIPL